MDQMWRAVDHFHSALPSLRAQDLSYDAELEARRLFLPRLIAAQTADSL